MSNVASQAEIDNHNHQNTKIHVWIAIFVLLAWLVLCFFGSNVDVDALAKQDSPIYLSMPVNSALWDQYLPTFLFMLLAQCLVVISWDFKRWRVLLDGEINHISYLCLDSERVFAYIKEAREQVPERSLYTVDLDNCNRIAALEQAERSVAGSNEPTVQPVIMDIPSRKAG